MRLPARLACGIYRVGEQVVNGNGIVDHAVDERRVGTIFQQTPHQVGQQRLVAAHRCVDAAGQSEVRTADHPVVQALAHAVQALQFELAGTRGFRQLQHSGEREGVVGGELGKDALLVSQQALGANQVRQVGVRLARVDGKVVLPFNLGALDLAVPIGALHQPDHEASAPLLRQLCKPVDHRRRTLLVSLHHDAQTIPAGQCRIGGQPGKERKRGFQAFAFLGVDVETDIGAAREPAQLLDARQQFGVHAIGLVAGKARVQCREFYGDARPLGQAGAGARGRGADRFDSMGIGVPVTGGVVGRERGLAEHVVGVPVAALFALAGTHQRLFNGAAEDELLAQQAHGDVDAGAYQRLAATRHQAVHGCAEAGIAMGGNELAGQHEAPGGCIDEDGAAGADMRAPVAMGQLVADQRVGGGAVGDPRQGFGQAHEGHAFLAGQRELAHERINAAAAAALVAQLLDPLAGLLAGGCPGLRSQRGLPEQVSHAIGLGPPRQGLQRRQGGGLRGAGRRVD